MLFLNSSRDSFLLLTYYSLFLKLLILFFICLFSHPLCSHLCSHSLLVVSSCFFELPFLVLLFLNLFHLFHLLLVNSFLLLHLFFFPFDGVFPFFQSSVNFSISCVSFSLLRCQSCLSFSCTLFSSLILLFTSLFQFLFFFFDVGHFLPVACLGFEFIGAFLLIGFCGSHIASVFSSGASGWISVVIVLLWSSRSTSIAVSRPTCSSCACEPSGDVRLLRHVWGMSSISATLTHCCSHPRTDSIFVLLLVSWLVCWRSICPIVQVISRILLPLLRGSIPWRWWLNLSPLSSSSSFSLSSPLFFSSSILCQSLLPLQICFCLQSSRVRLSLKDILLIQHSMAELIFHYGLV